MTPATTPAPVQPPRGPDPLRELQARRLRELIVLLLVVMAIATATRGARAWIPLPFFHFQPSELGKLALTA